MLGSSNASNVQIMATEYNSNYGVEGKQMTSLVNGLFVADSIGSLLNSGYTGGAFWDLRNGWNTSGNNSSTLYGWRQGGDEGILGRPESSASPPRPVPTSHTQTISANNWRPKSSRAAEARPSQRQTATTADWRSTRYWKQNGHLDLLVINKNPDAAINEQFSLQGFTPNGQAQFWQYGEAQDYAQSQSSTARLRHWRISLVPCQSSHIRRQ